MGQYRQWLYHREVDQLLQTQLATLRQQATQLQEQIRPLEQDSPHRDNTLLQALTAYCQASYPLAAFSASADPYAEMLAAAEIPVLPDTPDTLDEPDIQYSISDISIEAETIFPHIGEPEMSPDLSTDTVSPALFAWSRLPHFISQQIPPDPQTPPASKSTASDPDQNLLPEDLPAFVDGHAHTIPRIDIPWWLRSNMLYSGDTPASSPVDQQSARTNRLVQRWFERWGGHHTHPSQEQEDEQRQAPE